MELEFRNNTIVMNDKELNILDKLVLRFTKLLKFKYVIVSGYVAIFFGRSRNTEDVDVLSEELSEKQFLELCNDMIDNGFYILNTNDFSEAYSMFKEGIGVRFAEKGAFTPNFEIKYAKGLSGAYSLENRLKIVLNSQREFYIGPVEMQIAYKLYLGSEKDYQDARHLFKSLRKHLDMEKLKYFISALNIRRGVASKELGEDFEK